MLSSQPLLILHPASPVPRQYRRRNAPRLTAVPLSFTYAFYIEGQRACGWSSRLCTATAVSALSPERRFVAFARLHANGVIHVPDEDFAVAILARVRVTDERFDD